MLRTNGPRFIQRLNRLPRADQLRYANEPVGDSRACRTHYNRIYIARMFADKLRNMPDRSGIRQRAAPKFQDLHVRPSEPAAACAAISISDGFACEARGVSIRAPPGSGRSTITFGAAPQSANGFESISPISFSLQRTNASADEPEPLMHTPSKSGAFTFRHSVS